MGKVHQVPMRISQVRLDASQAEQNVRISLACNVLACVQRLFQGDPHSSLEKDGELRLLTNLLEQLEVLRVPRADLEHHARGVARRAYRLVDFVDVSRIADLHCDHFDSVLSRQFENPWQALRSEPLKVIGAGAGLVRPHPGSRQKKTKKTHKNP